MICIALPVNLTRTNSSISACRYAPAISAVATSRFSFAAIAAMIINDSFAIVGDAHSSLGVYSLCGLPSTHDLPLILPSRLNSTRSTGLSAPFFCSSVNSSGFGIVYTFLSSNCTYSLCIACIVPGICVAFLKSSWVQTCLYVASRSSLMVYSAPSVISLNVGGGFFSVCANICAWFFLNSSHSGVCWNIDSSSVRPGSTRFDLNLIPCGSISSSNCCCAWFNSDSRSSFLSPSSSFDDVSSISSILFSNALIPSSNSLCSCSNSSAKSLSSTMLSSSSESESE